MSEEPKFRDAPAPWTQEQVDSINGFQVSEACHPYTCGERTDGEAHVLQATAAGLVCPQCRAEGGRNRDYLQTWVSSFVADGSWRRSMEAECETPFMRKIYSEALARIEDFERALASGEPIEKFFRVTTVRRE